MPGHQVTRALTNEHNRVAVIRQLHLARPDFDDVLQILLEHLRCMLDVDLVMVNILTEKTQYFRAWSGPLPEDLAILREWPRRDESLCGEVVSGQTALHIPDILAIREESLRMKHRIFLSYNMRSYCGVPLMMSGEVPGVLAAVNFAVRPAKAFTEPEIRLMQQYASQIADRLTALSAAYAASHSPAEVPAANDAIMSVLPNNFSDSTLDDLVEETRLKVGAGFVCVGVWGERVAYVLNWAGRDEALAKVPKPVKEFKLVSLDDQLFPYDPFSADPIADGDLANSGNNTPVLEAFGVKAIVSVPIRGCGTGIVYGRLIALYPEPLSSTEEITDEMEVLAQAISERLRELRRAHANLLVAPPHMLTKPNFRLGAYIGQHQLQRISRPDLYALLKGLMADGLNEVSVRLALMAARIDLGPFKSVLHGIAAVFTSLYDGPDSDRIPELIEFCIQLVNTV